MIRSPKFRREGIPPKNWRIETTSQFQCGDLVSEAWRPPSVASVGLFVVEVLAQALVVGWTL